MFLDGTIYEMLTSKVSVHFSCKGNFCKFFLDLQPKIFKKKDLRSIGATLVTQRSHLASRRFRGVETVLENGPPIDQHTFSSDSFCQRMLPVLTFPPKLGLIFDQTEVILGLIFVCKHLSHGTTNGSHSRNI